MLIRGRKLLEDGTYSDLSGNGAALIREWNLFEARLLLDEIRYKIIIYFQLVLKVHTVSSVHITMYGTY